MLHDIAAQLATVELAWSLPADAEVTAAQRSVLQEFAGWGGLAPAFAAQPTGKWLEIADRLEEAVPADALRAAADQLDTSFFTPAPVTAAVYRLLTTAGFDGGHVLEPGCGSGAFMSAAPAGAGISWTGVEVDATSARVASLLHPTAEIIAGRLEDTVLRDSYYDAVVGNVPFSPTRVRDKQGRGGALHNYFIQRAVEAVRPGGLRGAGDQPSHHGCGDRAVAHDR